MRINLFWQLLIGTTLTFLGSAQLMWGVMQVGRPEPAGIDVYLAERMAPVTVASVAAVLESQGLASAQRLNGSFPKESDRVRIVALEQPSGAPGARSPGGKIARAPDGKIYRVSYPLSAMDLRRVPPFNTPKEVVIGALLCAPVFSALLAWYLTVPIRRLRQGFKALASGDLHVRLGTSMHGRRDEIADLARDFDVMATQLEHSIGARERLLHDVSHELRSPLSRLQLAISLARQNPERAGTSMERIEYEARRLESMVRELLALARTESGRAPEDHYFDLAGILNNVVTDARFEAQAAEVMITSNLDGLDTEELPSLRGNAELMRWAFENVVRNAVRFSSRGQTVCVGLLFDEAHGLYRVQVADEGPGAPPAALPSLFKPFVRADETSAGFGLGLAIGKRAVEAHGGKIEAANRPSGGLEVKIVLPVRSGNRLTQGPDQDTNF